MGSDTGEGDPGEGEDRNRGADQRFHALTQGEYHQYPGGTTNDGRDIVSIFKGVLESDCAFFSWLTIFRTNEAGAQNSTRKRAQNHTPKCTQNRKCIIASYNNWADTRGER